MQRRRVTSARGRARRTVVLGLTALAVLLALPAGAGAWTVTGNVTTGLTFVDDGGIGRNGGAGQRSIGVGWDSDLGEVLFSADKPYDNSALPAGCHAGDQSSPSSKAIITCAVGATPPAATVEAGIGDDTITTGSVEDDGGLTVTVNAGPGDDVTFPGPTTDVVDGGTGQDTVSYLNSDAAVTVTLDGSPGSGGDAAGDQLTGVETLSGTGYADHLTAGANDATLLGLGGDDALTGGAGDDILEGGLGADAIDGGGGVDLASYAGSKAGVTVDLGAGTATGGDATGDTLTGIEGLSGSDANDTLTGDAGNNFLYGLGGDDVLTGGAAADLLFGGDGVDTASYAGSGAGVTVSATSNFVTGPLDLGQGGDAQNDIVGSDVESLTGSAHDDKLVGNAGAGTLDGGAGDDLLDGGADTVKDTYVGGAGTDTVTYASHPGPDGVTVTLGGAGPDGETLPADVENLTGSPFADTLTGDANQNAIDGLAGDDLIVTRPTTSTRAAFRAAGPDKVTCGDGTDTARIKAEDNAATDCETVDHAAAAGGGGGAGAADPGPSTTTAATTTTPTVPAPTSGNGGTNAPGSAGPPVPPPAAPAGPTPSPVTAPVGTPRAVYRESFVLTPVAGVVLVDGTRLRHAALLTAATVDVRGGTVALTSARRDGVQQRATLTGGRFRVNLKTPDGATELALVGGRFDRCTVHGTAIAPGQELRHLSAVGVGAFRIRGASASATTLGGARWRVADACAGTAVRVRGGATAVRDFVQRRTTAVRGVTAAPGRRSHVGATFARRGPITPAERRRDGV